MTIGFERLTERIFRLRVPFENLYTSVFLVRCRAGDLLADTATTKADVERYVLPALQTGGFSVTDIFISHNHGDHMGGLPYVAAALPNARLHMVKPEGLSPTLTARARRVRDGDYLGEGICVWQLPGHTDEMAGLYDEASGTLLSFDALQLYGVGRYGTSVSDVPAYLATLTRIEAAGVDRIVAAHDYVGGGVIAEGRSATNRYLTACRAVLDQLTTFWHQTGLADASAIAAAWQQKYALPPVPPTTFLSLQKMN